MHHGVAKHDEKNQSYVYGIWNHRLSTNKKPINSSPLNKMPLFANNIFIFVNKQLCISINI